LNNPQGVALDSQGYLWVADAGSHTIRRINLTTNKVTTVAGLAGSAGLADGTGSTARFNAPSGISVEVETLAQQLEREKSGTAPPPVSVLVADTGNNVVRRVTEAGKVTTIGSGSSSPENSLAAPGATAAAKTFNAPSSVTSDALGNIYITEPGANKVKVVLASSGQVVQAAQSGTFQSPKGIAITQSGKVIVGGKNLSGQEIAYGQPVISTISPQTVSYKGGTRVIITGRNFAPETTVIVAGTKMTSLVVSNTETLSFSTPVLASGRTIVSVQNRGGLAQTTLAIQPPLLSEIPQGYITTYAGGSTFEGEGAAATTGSVNFPYAVSLDAAGNLYIADAFNNRIRKVDLSTGILTSIAGTGTLGVSEDGGLATATDLANPQDAEIDPTGNLLIADSGGNRIRRVDAKTGIISTVAGTYLESGFSGDGGKANSAWLNSPKGVFCDSSGNLYIADTYNNRIRKVDAATGIIATIAGNGQEAYGGDNGPATSASLYRPERVVADTGGNVFISDTKNHRIRRIDAGTKIITTFAGTGTKGYSGDGGPAVAAKMESPSQLSFDNSGSLYFADSGNGRIRKIDRNGVISTVVGSGAEDYSGDGGPALGAGLASPLGVAVDGAGQIFIADTANYRIRFVNSSSTISTITGNGHTSYLGDGGPAWAASLLMPLGLAFDSAGNLYIADQNNLRIRKVDAKNGTISTVAGTDKISYDSDNIPATSAGLGFPEGVAIDASGNILIADTLSDPYSGRVRKVDAVTGIISTFAGNGKQQSPSDNVQATQSSLVYPFGVAIDASGNLLIAENDSETNNHRVRKVNSQSRVITTIAGTGKSGYSGDNGPAVNAKLNGPVSVSTDKFGEIFIADSRNNRIRLISTTGIIYTVAGPGQFDLYCCDGYPAPYVSIPGPIGLVSDTTGNLYISGFFNRVIRVDFNDLNVTTVAGSYDYGFSGDGGPAKNATFLTPSGMAIDPAGNLYIADQFNNRVRVIKGPFK
jgi:sugar lactone lactonase YvrE